MAEVLTGITAGELVRRILSGERDFTATRLERDADLPGQGGYEDLLAYLRGQDLRGSPLVAEHGDWRGLKAPGLFFPFAKLAGADLSGAYLAGADLRRCDFSNVSLEKADLTEATLIGSRFMGARLAEANLGRADLYEANLSGADLRGADLSGALLLRSDLKEADLTGTRLTAVDLYRGDLRGAAGLEAARDLSTARFHQTVVTQRELAIIAESLRRSSLFDLREE